MIVHNRIYYMIKSQILASFKLICRIELERTIKNQKVVRIGSVFNLVCSYSQIQCEYGPFHRVDIYDFLIAEMAVMLCVLGTQFERFVSHSTHVLGISKVTWHLKILLIFRILIENDLMEIFCFILANEFVFFVNKVCNFKSILRCSNTNQWDMKSTMFQVFLPQPKCCC